MEIIVNTEFIKQKLWFWYILDSAWVYPVISDSGKDNEGLFH